MKPKLLYLEAVRGIAALIVVISHFARIFYPNLFDDGKGVTKHSVEWFISSTPLNLLYNGYFAVSIFFILSGFVLSYRYFQMPEMHIDKKMFTKRYLRMAIPIFISTILAYLIARMDLSYLPTVASMTDSPLPNPYNVEVSILHVLTSSFINIFFFFDPYLNPVLWTMPFELIGSFGIFALLALVGRRRSRFFVYVFLLIIMRDTWWLSFLCGMILADIFSRNLWRGFQSPFMKIGTLVLGIYVGSYPYLPTDETIYEPLAKLMKPNTANIIGACLLFIVILTGRRLQTMLSSRPFVKLGTLSFGLYLTHFMILFSFSCWLFSLVYPGLPFHFATSIVFIVSLGPVFIMAWLFTRWVDQPLVTKLRMRYNKTKHPTP